MGPVTVGYFTKPRDFNREKLQSVFGNVVSILSAKLVRAAIFAPASFSLSLSHSTYFLVCCAVFVLASVFVIAWLWLILLSGSVVSVVSRCFVSFGALGVAPQNFSHRDKSVQ